MEIKELSWSGNGKASLLPAAECLKIRQKNGLPRERWLISRHLDSCLPLHFVQIVEN